MNLNAFKYEERNYLYLNKQNSRSCHIWHNSKLWDLDFDRSRENMLQKKKQHRKLIFVFYFENKYIKKWKRSFNITN